MQSSPNLVDVGSMPTISLNDARRKGTGTRRGSRKRRTRIMVVVVEMAVAMAVVVAVVEVVVAVVEEMAHQQIQDFLPWPCS
jgi:hypothetical protein